MVGKWCSIGLGTIGCVVVILGGLAAQAAIVQHHRTFVGRACDPLCNIDDYLTRISFAAGQVYAPASFLAHIRSDDGAVQGPLARQFAASPERRRWRYSLQRPGDPLVTFWTVEANDTVTIFWMADDSQPMAPQPVASGGWELPEQAASIESIAFFDSAVRSGAEFDVPSPSGLSLLGVAAGLGLILSDRSRRTAARPVRLRRTHDSKEVDPQARATSWTTSEAHRTM